MSSVKSQTKWVAKYFVSVLLVLLIIYALIAYFTSKVSMYNFITAAFLIVVLVLTLAYYNLVNIRSAFTFLALSLILLVGVIGSDHPNVNAGQFQSVTLSTGQTFYGHLSNLNTNNATLTDVYTLQATQQQTTDKNKAVTPVLLNVSKVLPNPENKMTIKTDKILYWQNLQDNSKVTQAINKDLGK